MYRRWPLAALVAALALTTAPAAFGAGGDPPAAAGWRGREIRDPLPERVRDAVARFPRGWSAGSVGLGSGDTRPNGSRRVREVQRRLLRRGYRPGPIDGRFGTRTRAAVLWFQIKHGLPRTGRADARSVTTLRRPTSPPGTPATVDAPSPLGAATEEARTTAPSSPAATRERADDGVVLLVLLIGLGLATIAWWIRAELRARPGRPATVRGRSQRAQPAAVAPAPANALAPVVGYVTIARGAQRQHDLEIGARIIGSWCESHSRQLTKVVHDFEPAGGRIADRPGLAHALNLIAAGRVAGLVLVRLGDLTRSATELARLLQWLNTAEAFVIALDHELDTSTQAGEIAAGALIEIGAWEHARIAGRTEPGLTAIRAASPTTNHASVRDHPELSARISAMRAGGMSLQAISDTLNAEGVPTIRGGTHWRPSSVQAAAGYKRPPAKPNGIELPRLAASEASHTKEQSNDDAA